MRPRHLAIPPAIAPPPKKPAPHPRSLALIPSPLRPHCLARDRLLLWIPTCDRPSPSPDAPALGEVELERIKDTMVHAWEEYTRETYGTGLLMWHCFCDEKGVPEKERAAAGQTLLSAFVAHMASAYSGKTISSYIYGVRAWHILHSVPWMIEKKEMNTMLRAADKLTPSSSKRKKQRPYTPNFISAVRQQLNMKDPLDAAVFACLTTCFIPQPGSASLLCAPWKASALACTSPLKISPLTRTATASR